MTMDAVKKAELHKKIMNALYDLARKNKVTIADLLKRSGWSDDLNQVTPDMQRLLVDVAVRAMVTDMVEVIEHGTYDEVQVYNLAEQEVKRNLVVLHERTKPDAALKTYAPIQIIVGTKFESIVRAVLLLFESGFVITKH